MYVLIFNRVFFIIFEIKKKCYLKHESFLKLSVLNNLLNNIKIFANYLSKIIIFSGIQIMRRKKKRQREREREREREEEEEEREREKP